MLLFIACVLELIVILVLVYALLDRRLDVRLLLTEVEIDGIRIKGAIYEMDLRIGTQVTATVKAIDHKGHAAHVDDGSAEWFSTDESVATVEQDANDQLKAIVRAVGEGATQISVVADADLGDGVKQITGIGTIGVLPDDAVGFTNLAFDDITAQPDAAEVVDAAAHADDEVDTGGQGSGTEADR